MSNDEFLALHSRAQDNLNRYVTTNRAWRRIEQRQRVLLHMMNNDSEFLLSSMNKTRQRSSVRSVRSRLSANEICHGTR
jgi:hypothetical protein